jgi:hypothetical protein
MMLRLALFTCLKWGLLGAVAAPGDVAFEQSAAAIDARDDH